MLKIRLTGPMPLVQHIRDLLGKDRLKIYRCREDRTAGSLYLEPDQLEAVLVVEALKHGLAQHRRGRCR